LCILNSGSTILGLAACDEVDKGTSNGGGKSEMGPMTEVLTNTAVAGAAYFTSSGTAGATDEKGISKRNHGGTVELRLGSLIIGKIKAVPIVTPTELTRIGASGRKTRSSYRSRWIRTAKLKMAFPLANVAIRIVKIVPEACCELS
jgi:hypothetical protein